MFLTLVAVLPHLVGPLSHVVPRAIVGVLLIVVGRLGLNVVVVLDGVVYLREDDLDRIRIARVERQELNHRPFVEHLADGGVQSVEIWRRTLVQHLAKRRRVSFKELFELPARR